MTTGQFASAVLGWYDLHGRKDLPWQQNVTPYRVWISEIMLQQTQVATVLGYFDRFMAALPDVQVLADAAEDEVLHLWTGLGYYSRARNLQKAARLIVEQHGGELPCDVGALTALPGIGRSTAGAIASLSMNLRAPILDGNVKRVLCRYSAQQGYPGEPGVARRLWELAERLTPHYRVAHYTQAMMDLGATLCTRSKPGCLLCPLKDTCQARLLGEPQRYPQPKPRKALPQKHALMPVILNERQEVLLYRRPPQGLWGGLWSLPELEGLAALDDFAVRQNLTLQPVQALPGFVHTFSHFQLQIEPWLAYAIDSGRKVAEENWLWYNLTAPPRLGLAAPVKKLLKRVAADVLNAGEDR